MKQTKKHHHQPYIQIESSFNHQQLTNSKQQPDTNIKQHLPNQSTLNKSIKNTSISIIKPTLKHSNTTSLLYSKFIVKGLKQDKINHVQHHFKHHKNTIITKPTDTHLIIESSRHLSTKTYSQLNIKPKLRPQSSKTITNLHRHNQRPQSGITKPLRQQFDEEDPHHIIQSEMKSHFNINQQTFHDKQPIKTPPKYTTIKRPNSSYNSTSGLKRYIQEEANKIKSGTKIYDIIQAKRFQKLFVNDSDRDKIQSKYSQANCIVTNNNLLTINQQDNKIWYRNHIQINKQQISNRIKKSSIYLTERKQKQSYGITKRVQKGNQQKLMDQKITSQNQKCIQQQQQILKQVYKYQQINFLKPQEMQAYTLKNKQYLRYLQQNMPQKYQEYMYFIKNFQTTEDSDNRIRQLQLMDIEQGIEPSKIVLNVQTNKNQIKGKLFSKALESDEQELHHILKSKQNQSTIQLEQAKVIIEKYIDKYQEAQQKLQRYWKNQQIKYDICIQSQI